MCYLHGAGTAQKKEGPWQRRFPWDTGVEWKFTILKIRKTSRMLKDR